MEDENYPLEFIDEAVDPIDVKVLVSLDDLLQQGQTFVFYKDDQLKSMMPSLLYGWKSTEDTNVAHARHKVETFYGCLKDIHSKRLVHPFDDTCLIWDARYSPMDAIDTFMKHYREAENITNVTQRQRAIQRLIFPFEVALSETEPDAATNVLLDSDKPVHVMLNYDTESQVISKLLPIDTHILLSLTVKDSYRLSRTCRLPPTHFRLIDQIRWARGFRWEIQSAPTSTSTVTVDSPDPIEHMLTQFVTEPTDMYHLDYALEMMDLPMTRLTTTQYAAIVNYLYRLIGPWKKWRNASLRERAPVVPKFYDPTSFWQILEKSATHTMPPNQDLCKKWQGYYDEVKMEYDKMSLAHVSDQLNTDGIINACLETGQMNAQQFIQYVQSLFLKERFTTLWAFLERLKTTWMPYDEQQAHTFLDGIQTLHEQFKDGQRSWIPESIIHFNVHKDVQTVRQGNDVSTYNGVITMNPNEGNAEHNDATYEDDNDIVLNVDVDDDKGNIEGEGLGDRYNPLIVEFDAGNQQMIEIENVFYQMEQMSSQSNLPVYLKEILTWIIPILYTWIPFTMLPFSIPELCLKLCTVPWKCLSRRDLFIRSIKNYHTMPPEEQDQIDKVMKNPNLIQQYVSTSAFVKTVTHAFHEMQQKFKKQVYDVMWYVIACMCYSIQEKHVIEPNLAENPIQPKHVQPMFADLWNIDGPPLWTPSSSTTKGVAPYLLACLKHVLSIQGKTDHRWSDFLQSKSTNDAMKYIYKTYEGNDDLRMIKERWEKNAKLVKLRKQIDKYNHIEKSYLIPLKTYQIEKSKQAYALKYIKTLLQLPMMMVQMESQMLMKQGVYQNHHAHGCCYQELNEHYRAYGDFTRYKLKDLEQHRVSFVKEKEYDHTELKLFMKGDDGEHIKTPILVTSNSSEVPNVQPPHPHPKQLLQSFEEAIEGLLNTTQARLLHLPQDQFERVSKKIIAILLPDLKSNMHLYWFQYASIHDLSSLFSKIMEAQCMFARSQDHENLDSSIEECRRSIASWYRCVNTHTKQFFASHVHDHPLDATIEMVRRRIIVLLIHALCLPGYYDVDREDVVFEHTAFEDQRVVRNYYTFLASRLNAFLQTRYISPPDETSHKIAEYRENQKRDILNVLDAQDPDTRKVMTDLYKKGMIRLNDFAQTLTESFMPPVVPSRDADNDNNDTDYGGYD